jgi:hypothetical protein
MKHDKRAMAMNDFIATQSANYLMITTITTMEGKRSTGTEARHANNKQRMESVNT